MIFKRNTKKEKKNFLTNWKMKKIIKKKLHGGNMSQPIGGLENAKKIIFNKEKGRDPKELARLILKYIEQAERPLTAGAELSLRLYPRS
jgi:hypothetical protein